MSKELKDLQGMFEEILPIYRYSIDNRKTPDETVSMLVVKYGIEKTKEFCKAYCLGLPSDGRLYSESRKYLEDIPLGITADEAYFVGNLVEIHPSHMNQIIQSLMNIERVLKNLKEKSF